MKMPAGMCLLFMLLLGNIHVFCQQPVKHFNRSDFSATDSTRLANEYGNNKVLVPQFALPMLVALSYFPELKNTRIQFITKPAYSLLRTSPQLGGIMCRKTRRFSIVISDSTMWKLEPIMLAQMDFNTQVGVIGHELSHVSDFSRRSFINLAASGVWHLSSKYIDRFEYMTDSICIAHGLGYQLLAWSMFVRNALHTGNYDGADNINKPMMHERYMNPATITARMKKISIYNE